MARVLTCVTYDETAQACVTEAWVEEGSAVLSAMPTLEQANEVGSVMLLSLMTLAVVKNLLKPPRETDE